jgi:DNA integrity scanning protein DisA with diadenylate cyclase activity
LVAVHLNIIKLYDPPITQTLTGAQQAVHKVNEAIGKLESHYDTQLNLKDQEVRLLNRELYLA